MKFYYFLDAGAIEEVLRNREIRVTTLDRLNDLFDCTPRVTEYGEFNPELTSQMQEGVGKFLGMICYSRHRESVLLWAHYASKHTGIALEFDFDTTPGTTDADALHNIDYRYDNLRPSIDVSQMEKDGKRLSMNLTIEMIKKLYCVKGRDWFYEQETRRFIQFAIPSPFLRHDGEFYYEPFLPLSFTGVLRGAKCKYTAQQLNDLMGPNPVLIQEAVIDDKRNELTFFPWIPLADVKTDT